MSIKILVERKFKDTPSESDIEVIHKIRVLAMKQRGYIGGETLINYIDNKEVVIVAQWTDIDVWNRWINSKERKKLEHELCPNLAEPTRMRVYSLGFHG
jgi:antibiotic biosynthesis monooxygenase (ABM) superfamily enzyme